MGVEIHRLINPPPGVESAHIAHLFREYQLWVRLKGARYGNHWEYKTLAGAKSRFSKMHVVITLHPKPVWMMESPELGDYQNPLDPET